MSTVSCEAPTAELLCQHWCGVQAELGEGLLWDDRTQRLLMTDILQGRLLEWDLDASLTRSWRFDEPVAWVLPTERVSAYVLGLRAGLAWFDTTQPQRLQWLNRHFPGPAPLRLNDASVDARGQIWYGSMNSAQPQARDGRLASFTPGEGLRIHDSGFTVTNGPVLSADGRQLFLNDTLQGTVYRYSVSADGRRVSGREVFAQFGGERGYPDGMCLDTQGHLWVALWGAAAVAELDPCGRVLRRVAVPAQQVSNVCFVGPQLDRLIVSTAAIDLTAAQRLHQPRAGDLFEVLHHGRVGLPAHCVRLESPWT